MENSKNLKAVRIDIPIFYASIELIISEEYLTEPPEYFPDWLSESQNYMGRTGFDNIDGTRQVAIHCKTFAFSVIAHEAVHAANLILDSIGHKPEFDNDEVQAHLVQHIVEHAERLIYGI